MSTSTKILVATAALAGLLALPGTAFADNAIATRPMSVHAAPDLNAKVIALIGESQTISAKNCRKGWCTAQGGYVRSALLKFSAAAAQEGYDYNVPLGPPNYGYTPGFWGYGGKRYYDRYGNYSKYGERGYAGTEQDRLGGTVETLPGRRFGVR
jgi:hypothetical protein